MYKDMGIEKYCERLEKQILETMCKPIDHSSLRDMKALINAYEDVRRIFGYEAHGEHAEHEKHEYTTRPSI